MSAQNFAALAGGWILCQGVHTVSGAISAARAWGISEHHHSTLYYSFSRATWNVDMASQVLYGLLLPFLPERIPASRVLGSASFSAPPPQGGSGETGNAGSHVGRGPLKMSKVESSRPEAMSRGGRLLPGPRSSTMGGPGGGGFVPAVPRRSRPVPRGRRSSTVAARWPRRSLAGSGASFGGMRSTA